MKPSDLPSKLNKITIDGFYEHIALAVMLEGAASP